MKEVKLKPRFIVSGDWHVYNFREYTTSDPLKISRLEWQVSILRHLGKLARKLDLPILFTGDMFHDPQNLQNGVFDLFIVHWKKYMQGVKVIGISGNHDQSEKNTEENISPSYVKTLSEIMGNFYCIDNSWMDVNGIRVYGIPYLTNNKGFKKKVKEFSKMQRRREGKSILLTHRDYPNCINFDEHLDIADFKGKPEKMFKEFDLMLAGHIHIPQKICKRAYMVGAPQQQSWRDEGIKTGFVMVSETQRGDLVAVHKPFPVGTFPEFKRYPSGGKPGDDFNFWKESRPEEKVENDDKEIMFDSKSNKLELGKNYLKKVGETNKLRIKTLLNVLDAV